MPDPDYDLFLSHASEDKDWCEILAQRLRDQGVRVWFDGWELKAGDHLLARLNDGLKRSRKMVAVWSANYFRDDKTWTLAESFSKQHKSALASDRPLIPLLIEDCDVPPTFLNIIQLDFRNPDDFELRLRQLIEALDLPRREFAREEDFEFREHKLDPAERGRRSYEKGKLFVDEVAAIYRVLGYEIKQEDAASGARSALQIRKRDGIRLRQDFVECSEKLITAVERDQILIRQNLLQKEFPRHGWIAISARGFTVDARLMLEDAGFDCGVYVELLRELVPLDNYVDGLIADHEKWMGERWDGEDRFIRPDLVTDIVYERMPALAHLSKWLGEERRNQLVVLGDLGTGKTTLAGFLAYNLARSFRDDPLRHPAPVLIQLKDVRKEVSLEGIVISHFSQRGLRDISFTRFEHLVRLGKIILLFDAFDEMAERVRWDVTQSNFRELSRAAELQGKVVITCRTHYFKDRDEQVKVIGEGPRLSEVETELYRELRQRSNAEVVYLQEFDDRQIQDYLKKARPKDHAKDWRKIQAIYNLKDLATRPLLLDMIVKSLPRLKTGQNVNVANLYNIYTNLWIDREVDDKRRKFTIDKSAKLALMLELAWRMWRDEKQVVHFRELVPFIEKLIADKMIEIGDEEIVDVANEMQGASFLKRDDGGNFSFMHRSFGEFFVASKINDCLQDAAALRELLNTRRYDQKTIYFLAQLDEQDKMREPLRQILVADYQPNVSENALQLLYWSARIRAGMEEKIKSVEKLQAALAGRIPTGAKLDGANLQEITLDCADLTEADLIGADLTKAKLNHAKFDRAVLRDALLVEASVENALARGVDFRNADLKGASFVQSDLIGSDFREAWELNAGSLVNAALNKTRGLKLPGTPNTERLRPVAQIGASGGVNAVAYSPDGELVAAAGGDSVIWVYRTSDGTLLRALEGHTSRVMSVAFASDGRTLASGSEDKTVRLWQVNSGKPLRSLEGHTNKVRSVAFAPDSQTIASASDDKTIRLWQVESGNLLRTLRGHLRWVWSVAFAPDGQTIASGSEDGAIRLWQTDSGKTLHILEGHPNRVRSVAFAPDGQTIASVSEDTTVKLWQVESGETLHTLKGHTNVVLSSAFSPDGRLVASGGADKTIRLWQANPHAPPRIFWGHTNWVWSVAFAPDGQTIASGSSDKTVRLWQVNSGKLLRTLERHTGWVWSVAFAPDGRTIASAGDDKTIRLWQVGAGKHLRDLEGHTNWVRSVAFAPDGQTIASGSYDDTVRLWQANSGKLLYILAGHTNRVRSVAFAPDGQTIASGSNDNTVKLWQVGSGNPLHTLGGHTDEVRSVAFAPDGQTIASASDDKTVRLWYVKSDKPSRTLKGHTNGVLSVIFAPNGEVIASASNDKTVKLWWVESDKPFRTLEGHANWVRSVAFAPNGQTIASGSSDNTVKLWQVSSGEMLQTFEGHLGPVYAVAFAPNGRYLVVAGAAGRLQFWDILTGETFLYRYSFGPGAWLDLLPDGRFDASPEGMRYLGYTEEGTFNHYTAESLVKEFYAPDAVREVLEKYTK